MSMRNLPQPYKIYKVGEKMSALSVERYERDIVDKLRAYEKDGKGQLLELYTVEVGERQLPFVAFTTGEQVVVTARHHVNEFFGPTEAVMRLAESGQEGLTLIPVVDVKHYDRSEARKEDILKATSVSASVAVYDMLRGYKEGPPSNAKNDWSDYLYMRDNAPPYVAAIKRVIGNCALLIDLHNSALKDYFILTVPTDTSAEAGIFKEVAGELERGSQSVSAQFNIERGRRILHKFRSITGQTAINYAASLGKVNLGFEIPVYSNKPVPAGEWDELSDVEQLVDITAGTILSLARYVRQVN